MASKATIVGIGVDMLYLPRLRQLIARHARRVQHSLPSSAAAHSAPAAATTIAASRLARRVLHDAELDELRARSSSSSSSSSSPSSQKGLDDEAAQLRYLAVRWTAKEAAFKALYPRFATRETTSWHDALVLGRPKPSFTCSDRLQRAFAAVAAAEGGGKKLPKLHLSVSHDGDYVVSYVVAEENDD